MHLQGLLERNVPVFAASGDEGARDYGRVRCVEYQLVASAYGCGGSMVSGMHPCGTPWDSYSVTAASKHRRLQLYLKHVPAYARATTSAILPPAPPPSAAAEQAFPQTAAWRWPGAMEAEVSRQSLCAQISRCGGTILLLRARSVLAPCFIFRKRGVFVRFSGHPQHPAHQPWPALRAGRCDERRYTPLVVLLNGSRITPCLVCRCLPISLYTLVDHGEHWTHLMTS